MSDSQGELTFELSEESQLRQCSYGNLILNGKIFARDMHRDHAIDIMRRWNCHPQLLEACKAAEVELEKRYGAANGSSVDKLTLKIIKTAIEAAES